MEAKTRGVTVVKRWPNGLNDARCQAARSSGNSASAGHSSARCDASQFVEQGFALPGIAVADADFLCRARCLVSDNSLCERAIRLGVFGWRNWLFADTVAGAKAKAKANASMNVFSLIGTCKANGVETDRYLVVWFKGLPWYLALGVYFLCAIFGYIVVHGVCAENAAVDQEFVGKLLGW